MREIVLIGIGTGNPDHVTIEAIRALNAVDLVLIPRKGPAKADLAELRREICGRYLEGRARLVEFDLPVRDAEGEYRSGVADWHRAIAATYRALIEAEAGPDAAVALLVWGDPSLYDSTLRVLDLMALGGFVFRRRVVPGITSLQLLCARHGIALNAVGEAVEITTGRNLRLAMPAAASVAVMLDGGCAFRAVEAEGLWIYWGAYLGMPNEILIAGPLAEVAGRIAAVRAEARAVNGWIMDIYLLRRG
ncbi:precorrin-6A synthase (deacetylating) [uncultured Amaricoccus sp.]|uniref:precorrin-6A synthase (deacetylating) n=1 Tax=uncultured Amaricoccus sp. TaxID=339341 RepID=UPI00262257A5|nr:precorrin-6A synthase (deacetylating) [uncultured Amaricoccus sp.]